MRLPNLLKRRKVQDDSTEHELKVQIDRKGRLYINLDDLAQSSEFWRQVELAAKIRTESDREQSKSND